MSRNRRAAAFVLSALLLGMGPRTAWTQQLEWRAQAIGLLTDVSPAMNGHDLTEGYITQPTFMVMAGQGPFTFQGTLDLEGVTLRRGELNAGIWGEGYVDRRHPHTYLHEAMLTAQHEVGGVQASLSAGRGFAPFGSDDPMVRYFVKYPANHHLAQILERWVLLGALRRGPVTVEAGAFNGDEPTSPQSFGQIGRFGDSYGARVTVVTLRGLELSGSGAHLASPELATGGGLDQRKWHGAARLERTIAGVSAYGLVEYARTAVLHHGAEVFLYRSQLAEASAARAGWRLSARIENTVRPEEERLADPFRALRPPTDNSIVGRTRFRTTSLQLAYTLPARHFDAVPFIELENSHATAVDQPAIVDPARFYGRSDISTFSVGIRFGAGMPHTRMGRYGVALPQHEH